MDVIQKGDSDDNQSLKWRFKQYKMRWDIKME